MSAYRNAGRRAIGRPTNRLVAFDTLNLVASRRCGIKSVNRRRLDELWLARMSTLLQTAGMAGQTGAISGTAKDATRQRCALIVAAGLAVACVAGCARRAPGPDECHDLAVAWVLGPRLSHMPKVRISQSASEAILDRTTECLTTPYDRELVQCVTTGSAPQTCMRGFETRHPKRPASAAQ